MRRASPNNRRQFFFLLIVVGLFFDASEALAQPRGPLPPVPESGVIYRQGFDGFHSIASGDASAVVPNVGLLVQSWSGYALDRSGPTVPPWIIPALDATIGHTNLVCNTATDGAIRFYYLPYFSSTTAGGTGPGAIARLADLTATSANGVAVVWSLQVSADGSTLQLLGYSDSGPVLLASTPISWQANQSHMVALDYGPQGTALIVDGQIVAQGGGTLAIPLSVGSLALGSSISGADPAQGTVDEFYSFDRPLTAEDAAFYYRFTAAQAALGPLSAQEAGSVVVAGGARAHMALRPVFDPDHDMTCSPGGPVRLTNIVATLQTNGLATVSFDIQGGTNGVFYDIYSTPTLTNVLDNTLWYWLGQGLTCNTYTFTNQPPDQAFYILELPSQTTVWAWGQDTSAQCNVPLGLIAANGVAAGGNFSLALLTNGTVIGWGTNNLNQISIPSGITNATAIAAGQYHGLAVLTNGAVTNWGSYWDGTNFFSVTNYSDASHPPTSNVVAVAAGLWHDLALLSNGTVVAWGMTNLSATAIPTNLTGVKAIACGWNHNVALLSNGLVRAWGVDSASNGWHLTEVPPDLTNAVAIAAGPTHSLALRTNGTVEAWGVNDEGETNVPTGLSNVVAISAGGGLSLALHADGTLVVWGDTNLSGYALPTNMFGVKAIASGFQHNLAVASDGLPPLLTEPPAGFAPTSGSLTFSVSGLRVANVFYQWQFNGTNIVGATNATFTLTDAQATNQGGYQCVISNTSGAAISMAASFGLAYPPEILSTSPPAPSVNWITTNTILSVAMNLTGQSAYPLHYQWQFNGANLAGATNSAYSILNPVATNEGNYTVIITNSLGTNHATWAIRLAWPGMVEAWGDDESGEIDRPVTLTNAAAIAAGVWQSIAVTDSGTVLQWGDYSDGTNFYSVTNFAHSSAPPGSNVVAVAAGLGQALALKSDGTIVAWGLTNAGGYVAYGTAVPTNLTNGGIKAIACGWQFNVALLTNGTVTAWGLDATNLGWNLTQVPAQLTNNGANVKAIAAGGFHSLALTSSNTVVAWGENGFGECNVPAGLTNVVAIAAGDYHSLALTANGKVVAWGDNSAGQTNVPAGLSNVMSIAAGSAHSVALLNTNSIVEWGDNSSGQTNVPNLPPATFVVPPPFPSTNNQQPIIPRLIAAGGDHTLTVIFSPLVQYPVDVSKDLLLIYNTNSLDSSNVCQYYLTHRPMVGNANSLGIGCSTNEAIYPPDFTNVFMRQVQTWLTNNPTKRPLYVVLFQELPQEVDYATNSEDTASDGGPSVQYQLHSWTAPGWYPFVTAINMNGTAGTNYGMPGTNFNSSDGTNDCIAYINKLTNMAGNNPPGTLLISATAAAYGNSNWYFDWANSPSARFNIFIAGTVQAVTNIDHSASIFASTPPNISNQATNVAGYFTCGFDCTGDSSEFIDTTVQFYGNSGWYVMGTVDSFSGQRVTSQANYLTWFASNSFGGINYSNTPVGAVTYVDEPGPFHVYSPAFYGNWAAGKNFAISAWAGQSETPYVFFFQAVGDPFVRK